MQDQRTTLTRRTFIGGATALAASSLMPRGARAQDHAKPDSKFNGVQIGIITYSYRSLPGTAEDLLKYITQCGISSIELMGGPAEQFAGAPRQGRAPARNCSTGDSRRPWTGSRPCGRCTTTPASTSTSSSSATSATPACPTSRSSTTSKSPKHSAQGHHARTLRSRRQAARPHRRQARDHDRLPQPHPAHPDHLRRRDSLARQVPRHQSRYRPLCGRHEPLPDPADRKVTATASSACTSRTAK